MVYQVKDLNEINKPNNGDFALVGDEKACQSYVYHNNSWDEVKGEANFTEYELMKTAVLQLPTYNQAQLEQAKNEIIKFKENNPSDYYMMLNRDYNYYTLFQYDKNNHKKEDKFEQAVLECIMSQGEVKSISYPKGDMKLEYWVKTDTDECSVGYIFDYTEGVVKFN